MYRVSLLDKNDAVPSPRVVKLAVAFQLSGPGCHLGSRLGQSLFVPVGCQPHQDGSVAGRSRWLLSHPVVRSMSSSVRSTPTLLATAFTISSVFLSADSGTGPILTQLRLLYCSKASTWSFRREFPCPFPRVSPLCLRVLPVTGQKPARPQPPKLIPENQGRTGPPLVAP